MTPDIINALFEVVGALFLSLNVIALYRHKEVKGVSLLPTFFYTTWGAWNVYYYPIIGQYWSGVAGVLVLVVNFVWVSMALYYRKNNGYR